MRQSIVLSHFLFRAPPLPLFLFCLTIHNIPLLYKKEKVKYTILKRNKPLKTTDYIIMFVSCPYRLFKLIEQHVEVHIWYGLNIPFYIGHIHYTYHCIAHFHVPPFL